MTSSWAGPAHRPTPERKRGREGDRRGGVVCLHVTRGHEYTHSHTLSHRTLAEAAIVSLSVSFKSNCQERSPSVLRNDFDRDVLVPLIVC